MNHYSNMLRVTARGYIDYAPQRMRRKKRDADDPLSDRALPFIKNGIKIVKSMLGNCKGLVKLTNYNNQLGPSEFSKETNDLWGDAIDLTETADKLLGDAFASGSHMYDEYERLTDIIHQTSFELDMLARKTEDIFAEWRDAKLGDDVDEEEYYERGAPYKNEYQLANLKVRELGGMLEYTYDLLVRMQQQAKGY